MSPFGRNPTAASEILGWLLFEAGILLRKLAVYVEARGGHCMLWERGSHLCAMLSRSFPLYAKIRIGNL